MEKNAANIKCTQKNADNIKCTQRDFVLRGQNFGSTIICSNN